MAHKSGCDGVPHQLVGVHLGRVRWENEEAELAFRGDDELLYGSGTMDGMAIRHQVDWLFGPHQQTTEKLDVDLVVDVLVGQHETHLAEIVDAGNQVEANRASVVFTIGVLPFLPHVVPVW